MCCCVNIMAFRASLIALLALASSGLVSCGSMVALLDGTGRYLLNGVGERSVVQLPRTAAVGTLCAASGLFPPFKVDVQAAQQVRPRHAGVGTRATARGRASAHSGAQSPRRAADTRCLGWPGVQVEELVVPNVFDKPRAVVMLHVAGLGDGAAPRGCCASRAARPQCCLLDR